MDDKNRNRRNIIKKNNACSVDTSKEQLRNIKSSRWKEKDFFEHHKKFGQHNWKQWINGHKKYHGRPVRRWNFLNDFTRHFRLRRAFFFNTNTYTSHYLFPLNSNTELMKNIYPILLFFLTEELYYQWNLRQLIKN